MLSLPTPVAVDGMVLTEPLGASHGFGTYHQYMLLLLREGVGMREDQLADQGLMESPKMLPPRVAQTSSRMLEFSLRVFQACPNKSFHSQSLCLMVVKKKNSPFFLLAPGNCSSALSTSFALLDLQCERRWLSTSSWLG